MGRKNSYLPYNGLRGQPLSLRELKAAFLYLRGASITQIAEKLFISMSTARSDLQKVIYKMGAPNITTACYKAGREAISIPVFYKKHDAFSRLLAFNTLHFSSKT